MPPSATAAPHRIEAGTLGAWWYALKPASWPKLLVPALLGQALGVAVAQRIDPAAFAFGLAFTVLDLAYVVLLNDWGDREVDAIKRRMFPDGCSPKTIPDGILGASQVLKGGIAAGIGALLVVVAAALALDRPLFVPLGLLALSIFAGYTYRPLALNYRGGGELAEMFGVGFVLPWMQAYLQSGALSDRVYLLLLPYTIVSLSSALASGLADEESDRAGGKHTFATRFGNPATRRAAELFLAVGTLAYLPAAMSWIAIPPVAIGLLELVRVRARSAAAVTNAFEAQGGYKKHLHLAIWVPGVVLAALLMITGAMR